MFSVSLSYRRSARFVLETRSPFQRENILWTQSIITNSTPKLKSKVEVISRYANNEISWLAVPLKQELATEFDTVIYFQVVDMVIYFRVINMVIYFQVSYWFFGLWRGHHCHCPVHQGGIGVHRQETKRYKYVFIVLGETCGCLLNFKNSEWKTMYIWKANSTTWIFVENITNRNRTEVIVYSFRELLSITHTWFPAFQVTLV